MRSWYIDIFQVGDRVRSRENLNRKGTVIAVITDGKLSKDFIEVRWDDGEEEMVIAEWLIKEKTYKEYEESKNVVKGSKQEMLKPVKASDELWKQIVFGLSKYLDIDTVKSLVYKGSLYQDLHGDIVLVAGNRRVRFRKHLDYDEYEPYKFEKNNKKVDIDEFKRDIDLSEDQIKISSVQNDKDTFVINFGNESMLIDKESLVQFFVEAGVDVENIFSELEKKGSVVIDLDILNFEDI